MAKTIPAHRVRWFVYAGSQKIPRTSTMRGQWGSVQDAVDFHKWENRSEVV